MSTLLENNKLSSLFDYFGTTIFSHNNEDINQLPYQLLIKSLATSGIVLLRNFDVNVHTFSTFIENNSDYVTFDPARKPTTKSTAEIQAGDVEMGLHMENGNLPFSPELQWFYCGKAAKEGSETTFCDGLTVWQKLSPMTQKKFLNKKVKYSRDIPWDNVKRYLSLELQQPVDRITDEHLEYVNAIITGQTYTRINDESIHSEYVVSAVIDNVFNTGPCFCNSLMSPSVNYRPPKMTWEDDTEISEFVWTEIKDICEEYTRDHKWQDNDVIIVDNTRVMHGRRKVLDPLRKMFGAQSYLVGGNYVK
ncbi:TauD/TfdA family dioxygenase [Zooshikella harenae]|uniref:TauD/TfdA family dioxygenase n=1 Tax=Zooshikella harenae TaxID=2827238 RepID=A0ABS5ZG50_9GAMM|nr:TauD/TfdA family dioxygenase [Zooshikella harenae]MBU2711957.1 TauD/TfdA family dioxygenase [Zooshikella harenae]